MIETVSALFVDADEKVLLGLRAAWKRAWPCHWDAIGGRVEPGEGLEQALLRECREEVGLVPTRYELVVWVGDEIKIEPKSIAVAASEYAEPDMAGNARSSTGNPDEASARESSRGGVTLTWLELGLMLVVVVMV